MWYKSDSNSKVVLTLKNFSGAKILLIYLVACLEVKIEYVIFQIAQTLELMYFVEHEI